MGDGHKWGRVVKPHTPSFMKDPFKEREDAETTHGSEVEDKNIMWTPLLGENMADELSSLIFSLD